MREVHFALDAVVLALRMEGCQLWRGAEKGKRARVHLALPSEPAKLQPASV